VLITQSQSGTNQPKVVVDTSNEPDYLVISPVSATKEMVLNKMPCPPKPVPLPPEEDYIMIGGTTPPMEVSSSGSVATSAENDYMDFDPGKNTEDVGSRAGVRPRPRLPAMPVPLPKLEAVVSPIRDTNAGEEPTDIKVTPLPSSEIDEYIEIGRRDVSPQIVPKQTNLTSSGISTVLMATTDENPELLITSDALLQQLPLNLEAQLSTSKTSLNSAGGPEVNYATLDLQTAGGDEGNVEGTQRPKHASGGSSAGSDSADESPLQYAQIDFKKSEQLRKSANAKKTRAPFDI
jgi:hypothetical protein